MQIPLQQTVAPRLSSLLLLRLNQPDTHVRVVRGGPDPCGFRRLFQEKVGGPRNLRILFTQRCESRHSQGRAP